MECSDKTTVIVGTDPVKAGLEIKALPDSTTCVDVVGVWDDAKKRKKNTDMNGEVEFEFICKPAGCPCGTKVVFHAVGYEDAQCEFECHKKSTHREIEEGEITIVINPSLISSRMLSNLHGTQAIEPRSDEEVA
jgi:hypothetical protein